MEADRDHKGFVTATPALRDLAMAQQAMLATRAAEIAVERYGINFSTMKAQIEPITRAVKASGRSHCRS
jgi:hypothetical protein